MRALLLLTLAAVALCASADNYVYPRALRSRQPVRYLIRRSANPRLGFSFVEAQLSRRVLQQLLSARYPQPSREQLVQLAGSSGRGQLPRLQSLISGPYRRLVQPIYPGLLPYYLYNRGGSRMFSRKSLMNPLRRLTQNGVQLQFLRFLTRIDPRLVNQNVGDNTFSAVRSSLMGINRGYGLPVPILRNLYNTFISVIGGNGRSKFLLGLSPERRMQHFSTSLGMYLGQNRGQLPSLRKNNALLYQGFAGDVDSRYILHNSGIRLLGQLEQRQHSEADRFFFQLENDHFEAVSDVLSSIFRVQRSISLSSLPNLGYSGLLARRFYPGLHVGQTDIIARYILRALSGYGAIRGGAMKSGGLMQSLPYLPYVQGLPANTISVIQKADLGSILGGLKSSGLSSRLTPGILQAARSGPFITQALLAAMLHGVRFTSPQQGTLLFRDVFASLLMHEKKFNPARFTSFLDDPIRPFVLLNRVIVPNTLPAIRRIPNIQLLPLNSIVSLRSALRQGMVRLPSGLAQKAGIILRPRPAKYVRYVQPAPRPVPVPVVVPVVITEPPFPSIVVSQITLQSSVARQLYAVLRGGIPIMTLELLQPVMQLLVTRRLIPLTLLRTPAQLAPRLQSVLRPVQPLFNIASQMATVPSFITDKAFTPNYARMAFILDTLVIYSHGYRQLEAPMISSSVLATLRAYYAGNNQFQPTSFLRHSDQYFPQLIGGGLLARPLQFGSVTMPPSRVTATLSGLRLAYGQLTYHGLGTVLNYKGAKQLLSGVNVNDTAALIKALTFGATKPVFQLSPSDVTGLQGILKPLTTFNQAYSVPDLQFLFSFGVQDLRIPRSIYSRRIAPLFRESLTSFIATKKPLVTNRIYNPAYLNLVINDFLVDKLTSGYLSPKVRVSGPSGGPLLTLGQTQMSSLVRQSLQPLQLRLLPPFVGQLLSLAMSEVPVMRHVKPSALLPSFGRYLGSGPFNNFRFSLTNNEFSGMLGRLTKQRKLPGFFLRYPSRLQRYYFDNLFGSYAAYSLLHSSSNAQYGQRLQHSTVFSSFSQNLIPSFFRSRKFGNLGDLMGVAPDYFNMCRRSFKTLPGRQDIQQPAAVGGVGHVANGKLLSYGAYQQAGGFFSR